jgi:hypothetical protein
MNHLGNLCDRRPSVDENFSTLAGLDPDPLKPDASSESASRR